MDDHKDTKTAAGLPEGRKPRTRPNKRLIVFADGTGNAFGGQASNIWRLYEAIDKRGLSPLKSSPQLARYIPGVGTSSIGLVRLFDGATGLGVPGNVQKLYRFLCWNWEPGDEIWMFGFSRGAFTVRTLAGLISSQGLMPREVDGTTASVAEMHRNSKGAWRAYRRQTAPFRDPRTGKVRMSPTVSIGRFIRDACVWAKRTISRQKKHVQVTEILQTRQPERCAGQIKIRFLGLFDTVEAYGVPLEELRAVFDFWIWPISFRNRVCSPVVEHVCHALSLDDERRTYHPLRFDQTPQLDLKGSGNQKDGPRIKEVWFAGVHADIGGGYPDDEASLEPLIWMIEEARKDGLIFIDEKVHELDSRRSKNALIHDSRSGLKSAYRYTPRPVESGEAFGGKPVVHSSVVQKILTGRDGYAPVMMNDDFQPHDQPQQVSLHHNAEVAEQVKALVLWRRIANISFISLLLFALVLPWAGEPVRAMLQPGRPPVGSDGVVLPDSISSVAPGIVQPWIQSLWKHPVLSIPLILAIVALFLSGAALRDRIKDTARQAWTLDRKTNLQKPADRFLVRTGNLLQSSRTLNAAYAFLGPKLVQVVLAVLILLGVFKLVHVFSLMFTTVSGSLCPDTGPGHVIEPGSTFVLQDEFSPQSVCWPTGVNLVEGQTYWIRLEETDPFTDRGARVPMTGFQTNKRVYVLGSLIRRSSANWFQPVAQIGAKGQSILPLFDYTDKTTAFISCFDDMAAEDGRNCDPIDAPKAMTARIRAERSGPLFLYVNDAIIWPFDGFYANNGGSARVSILAEEPPL